MKMKFYIYCCLFLWIGTSCTDVLDVAPDGRKSLDDIFTDPVSSAAYLNTCYKYMRQRSGAVDYFNTNSLMFSTDEAWDRDDMEAGTIQSGPYYRGALSAANPLFTADVWNNYWSAIRCCNIFIERIPDAPLEEGAEDEKAQWIAEAKVLRAHYFLELIIRYGGMPILVEPLDINDNCSTLKKEDFKICIDRIITDCNEAMQENTLPWRRSGNEAYRMTQAMASGIKSRAILFAASNLWNGGQNYWNEAESITKTALDDCLKNGYELYNKIQDPKTFASAYQEYFCIDADFVDDPIDKETIISSKNVTAWRHLHGLPIQNAFKAGLCPTQEMVDAYGMQESGLPILNLEKPYLDEMHLQPNYNTASGYDPKNPYEGRDPRFYASIWHNGSQRINVKEQMTTIETFEGGNCGIKGRDRKHTITGYYLKKGDHPQSTEKRAINKRMKMMRLAELYLNYAEAANENGNLADAVAAVNVIRERAGMPPIAPKSQQEARLLIRNERRVELAFEEIRGFDVRRWQKPDGNLADTDRYITGLWLLKKEGAKSVNDVKYMRFVIGDSWDPVKKDFLGNGMERMTYSNAYLIYPIPLSESNRLRGATGEDWQNPGW